MEEMGTSSRGTDDSLDRILFDHGYSFDFYQAVRMLEALSPLKGLVSVGEGSIPDREPLRFKSRVDLGFPPSDIFEISRGNEKTKQAEMSVNFMGIAGLSGPMPQIYTELILERNLKKDKALSDFIDIFNHRLLSLMYRVRKMHRIGFTWSPPEKSDFARYFFSLIGLGTGGLNGRMRFKERGLLYYTGILSQKPRSMKGLEQIVSHYFGVRCKGRQMCGGWLYIEKDNITKIGKSGRNQVLGRNALIGMRVWDQQQGFELVLTLADFDMFLSFLPGRDAFESLLDLTRFYAGKEIKFDFLLRLKGENIPESRLGGFSGPRLGWTSWLRTGRFLGEYGQVRLKAHNFVRSQ